ncbi:diguanylate cyclase [Oceanispirochaeta sp.]|jgi:diguanylate cyclase (GGDEF)-like protein|uniref:sensor domain-containing diguanylate cyclase n=1 Tax=Oceanispirochaeta sp. TaxID=2035350 RepID=UPI00263070D7|nr:diguanylate cyclase [Oceanispirochaeta sp.]MDA3958694.1 diguanylate cyclase [Oceanispirochaeta sp.]
MNHDATTSIDARIDEAYLLTYKSLVEAEELVEACLDDSEQQEYAGGIINSRILLSLIAVHRGDSDLVRDKLTRIEEELKTTASDDSLMRLAHVRGLYFMKDGVHRDSFDAFVKAGNLAARLGNQLFQALSANGKGVIKLDQHEYQDSYDYFRVAGTYLQGLPPGILNSVLSLNMACALNGLNRDREALEILKMALKRAEELNAVILECSVLDEISLLLMKQGHLAEARGYLERGLEISKDEIYCDTSSELVYHYAELLVREGNYAIAEALIEKYGTEAEGDIQLGMYHKIAAEIFEKKGEFQKALESYKTLNTINEKIQGTQSIQSVFRQEKRELQDQNHRLMLISTIGQELVANLDIGQILNLIYEQMNALMPVDLFSVATVSGNDIEVKFTVYFGERIEPYLIHKEDTNSLMGWTARNDKEIFMRDVKTESYQYVGKIVPMKGSESDGMNSVICIPLHYITEIVGVLSVQSGKANAYSGFDLDNLRALASYAGIALRNALQTEKMSELNEVLRRQSSVDSLTGLVNRREFERQAKNIWRVCRRNNLLVSLIMIDLDHFKDINDTHGHIAGDEVLKKIGMELNDFFKRPLDCASRYGGEELLILAGDMSPREAAVRVELLREEFSRFEFESPQGKFKVNFSCGICGKIPELDVETQISKITGLVDRYLYQAKDAGRNCTYLSDNMDKPAIKFVFSHLE